MGDIVQIATELLEEARTFLSTQPISGIDLAQEALEYARSSANLALQREALHVLAELAEKAAAEELAQQYFEQLLLLPLPEKERVEVLYRLSQLFAKQQQFQKAEQTLQQALPYLSAVDSDLRVSVWTALGIAQTKQGKIQAAGHAYRQGLAAITPQTALKKQAILYRCLGNNAFAQRHYEEAYQWFQRSLKLRQQIGDRRGYAILLSNLANYYTFRGEYYQALQTLLEALRIYEHLNDQVMLISAHTTLGLLFSQTRQFASALEQFDRALALAQQLQLFDRCAKIYNNIGEVYRKQEQFRTARLYFGKALATLARLKTVGPEKAVILANVGLTFKAEGKPDAAERTLRFALQLLSPPTPDLLAGIHIALVELALQKGQSQQAQASLDAIAGFIDLPELLEYAGQFYRIASQLAAQQQDFAAAYHFLQKAIDKEAQFQQRQQQQLFAELQFQQRLAQERQQLQFLKAKNTELVHLVEHLKTTNAQLHRHSEYVSNMLNLLAHDLKNPLLSLRLLLYRISQLPNLSTEQLTSLTAQADHIITQMHQLVVETLENLKANDLLPRHQCETLSLASLLRPLIKQYEPIARAKHVTLKLNLHNPNLEICSAPVWLRQILDNLLSNAIKYTHIGTTVTIQTRTADAHCVVDITDQGPGIPPEEQDQLFKKFTPLSTKPTAGEHSTGLGLYLAKQLADLLHCRISVASEVGKGTTFSLQIPLQPQ